VLEVAGVGFVVLDVAGVGTLLVELSVVEIVVS